MRPSYPTKPTFDLLEIINELELPYRTYQPLKPVKAGSTVAEYELSKDYNNWRQYFNGSQVQGPVVLRQLLAKPIVFSFFSLQWGETGINRLKQLNAVQHEIKAAGANLLIITPDDESKPFEKLVWDNSLSLSFYFDQHNLVAQRFKLYADQSPVWNIYSGMDSNVPLLATYVVDNGIHILYDEVDHELNGSINSAGILDALHRSSLYAVNRRSA